MKSSHQCRGRMPRGRACWHLAIAKKQGKWWCRRHLPHDAGEPFLTDLQIDQTAQMVDLHVPSRKLQESLKALIRELRYFRQLPEVRRRLT